MTWETGTTTFTCECGATYRATYHDWPSKEQGQFKCRVPGCRKIVHEWHSTRDYDDWELISPPPNR